MDSEVLENKNWVLFRKLIRDCPGHERQQFIDRFWLQSRNASASMLRS